MLKEAGDKLNLSRIHFVGRVADSVLHNLYQVSACHVYLTYPFVLSLSLLEAMSCGAAIIGSATAPAEEVRNDKNNGLLVNFIDTKTLAD